MNSTASAGNARKTDVVILGSGFAGSLLAMILRRQGRAVVLIDKATHPRFAIGESSTPTANMVLASLSEKYDLPRLAPLARYGTWKAVYPQLTCGLKRGFSYFQHHPHAPFQPRADHGNALLVAANRSDQVGDTQWLRAEVDAFFASEARDTGVDLWEATDVDRIAPRAGGGWQVTVRRDQQTQDVAAGMLVDATGAAGVMPRSLKIPELGAECRTNSRALFGHFRDVKAWQGLIAARGCRISDHPFPCDAAAQHHILEEGWMWLLRFDNRVTSAGLVLDAAHLPSDPSISPQQEWRGIVERYPDLRELFFHASLVDPPGPICRTGRLQRRWAQIVGSDWAALPATAGFIDPLHSTGIAHALCGVERLAEIFERHWHRPSLANALTYYQRTVLDELDFVDQLVAACYQGLASFPLLTACTMLYFAAATTYEERRAGGATDLAFLCANDQPLRAAIDRLTDRLAHVRTEPEMREFTSDVATAIRPFNSVGLCDPAAQNMYRYTAAPEMPVD